MAGKFQIQKRPFSQLFPPSFLRKESCQKLLDYWLVDALVRPIESQCLKITEKVSLRAKRAMFTSSLKMP